jgi:uncharacterized protein (TIGR03067 family)
MGRRLPMAAVLAVCALSPLFLPYGAKQEVQLLGGTWKLIEATDQGDQLIVQDIRATFRYGKLVLREGGKVYAESAFKLDPTTSPNAIDLTGISEGPSKGKTLQGIYRIEGDRLTICVPCNPGVRERPTEFKAPSGSKCSLFVLKRIKE